MQDMIGDFVTRRATWVGLLAVLVPCLALFALRCLRCRRGRRPISGIFESLIAMPISVGIVEVFLHRVSNMADSLDLNDNIAMFVECPLAACLILWGLRKFFLQESRADAEPPSAPDRSS